MITHTEIQTLVDADFANLGLHHVGYIRQLSAGEIVSRFPGSPELPGDMMLWVLFGANGEPIVVSDHLAGVHSGALEQDLEMIRLN